MSHKRCGSCDFLDTSSETNIGGLRIAKCIHPLGVMIETTPIRNDYVALDAGCTEHLNRLRRGTGTGGCHV